MKTAALLALILRGTAAADLAAHETDFDAFVKHYEKPSRNLPCNCTLSCEAACGQSGMVCCGDGNDCNCSNLASCPKCDPAGGGPAPPRARPPNPSAPAACVGDRGACSFAAGSEACCPGLTCEAGELCVNETRAL